MSYIAGLNELRPIVVGMVQDRSDRLKAADFDQHIRDALLRFSRRKPRRLVRDVDGDGGWEYPMPDEWVPDSSTLVSLEHPLGERPPAMLEARDYSIGATPDGDVLRFNVLTPAAGTKARLTITTPHAIDATTSTVPSADRDTLTQIAAGYACRALAAFYSGGTDMAMRADSVQHGSKGSEFAKRAREFLAAAGEEMDGDTGGQGSQSGAQPRAAAKEVSFAGEITFLSH